MYKVVIRKSFLPPLKKKKMWPFRCHYVCKQWEHLPINLLIQWACIYILPTCKESDMTERLNWTELTRASLVAQMVKRLSAMQESQVWSQGWEDLLEKEMAAHSSTLAWKIPWTLEPGRLPSMGSQRLGHNWATSLSLSPVHQVLWTLRIQK